VWLGKFNPNLSLPLPYFSLAEKYAKESQRLKAISALAEPRFRFTQMHNPTFVRGPLLLTNAAQNPFKISTR
jgi:hypothetical protein